MTAVLVKRDGAGGDARTFARSFDSLPAHRRVHGGACSRGSGSTARCCRPVDLAVEELFTNMVKYSADERRRRCASTWPRSTAASR